VKSGFLSVVLAGGLAACSYGQAQFSSGAAGAGVGVQGGVSGVSTLFWLGVAAAAEGAEPGGNAAPPLDPARRVREQDCSRPPEDPSANLKCR